MRFAAYRRLGLRKNAGGLAPFVRFFSATFFVRWNCFVIPYPSKLALLPPDKKLK
jgi:hypothetical protein